MSPAAHDRAGHPAGDTELTPINPLPQGQVVEVEVNVGDDVYLDVERDFAAALARD